MAKSKSITNKRARKRNNKKSKKINKKNKKHTGGYQVNNNTNNTNKHMTTNINNNNFNDEKPNNLEIIENARMSISYRYAGIEFIKIDKDFEIDKKDIHLYEMQNMPYVKLSSDLEQNLDNGSRYVLVMYDDNSYVTPEQLNQYKNKTPPFYLHMVVEYTGEHKYGLIRLDYAPPTPPDNSGPHNYIFQLYNLDGDKKLNNNKLNIIEADRTKRTIHSEEHNHLDYLLVLLGLNTGVKPIDTVQFKVNTNNNDPLPPNNMTQSLPTTQSNTATLPAPAPLSDMPDPNTKTINIGIEQQSDSQVEPDVPNEVNDKVLDSQAEHEDKNEHSAIDENADLVDPNEEVDKKIDDEFTNIEKP